VKRSEIYRGVAERIANASHDGPWFFGAMPADAWADKAGEKDEVEFVADYFPVTGPEHLPKQPRDIKVLAALFLAEIAESEERS
jgi:hypothetical protein